MREDGGRGVGGLWGNNTAKKICDAIARRASHAGSFQFGQVAAEAEALRSDLAAHEAALQVRSLGVITAKRNRPRSRFAGGNKGNGSRYEILRFPFRWSNPSSHKARPISSVRAAFRSAVRSASGHDGGNPFALAYFTGNKNTTSRCAAVRYGEAGR